MSNLRHDLVTSGWSMIPCHKWLDGFNRDWQDAPFLEYKYWGLFPKVYRDFIGEMDWLLHEALPNERFRVTHTLAISNWSEHSWHRDYCYLRVLFTPRGEGTWVSKGFENNIVTPYGYALIMSGLYRKGFPATWHTSPHSAYDRRLLVVDFTRAY